MLVNCAISLARALRIRLKSSLETTFVSDSRLAQVFHRATPVQPSWVSANSNSVIFGGPPRPVWGVRRSNQRSGFSESTANHRCSNGCPREALVRTPAGSTGD
jgi:hypothetical protein